MIASLATTFSGVSVVSNVLHLRTKKFHVMNTDTQKTYTFYVSGMYCQSCVLLTESELAEYPGVTKAETSLKTNTVTVTGDFDGKTPEVIAQELTILLFKHGYSLSVEKVLIKKEWADFQWALPIALLVVLLFVGLQKLGLVNVVDATTVSYSTVFFIGVIASLSTCMAVVGGLVLSLSATFAKKGGRYKPQVLFHIGRIASFFFFGGVIGAIGATVTFNTEVTFVLGLLVGLVMLVLGINLLDVFPWAKKLQPALPKALSKYAFGVSTFTHTLTPLFIGVATFFFPCGFTQSMQLYSLTTGSFQHGALTMLIFALGTLPVLALIGFSALSIEKSSPKKKSIFFKATGLIIILFAFFNIINSFVIMGFIPALFRF